MDMDDRLDEAARVIDTMGSVYPFKVTIDSGIFRPLFIPHKMIVASGAQKTFEPDYLAFTSYVFAGSYEFPRACPDTDLPVSVAVCRRFLAPAVTSYRARLLSMLTVWRTFVRR